MEVNMKYWLCTISVLTICLVSFAGCGNSSSNPELQKYLTQVDPLITEVSDLNSELLDEIENAGPFGLANPEKILTEYKSRFNDVLIRFSAIECPQDAIKLREHTIKIINLYIQMIDAVSSQRNGTLF